MDDRRAHFLSALGDACLSAALARLTVEIEMLDGTRFSGVPSPQPADTDTAALDDTGYAATFLVGGSRLRSEDVTKFAVLSP